MGEIASCDELDIGLTSWHQDKQQTNYIDEGDGFLADSICQDGYIMNFFFRNFPHQSIMLTKDTPQHMLMCCSFLTCLRKKSHGWARQFVHEGIVSMGCLYWKNQVKIHGVACAWCSWVCPSRNKKTQNEAALVWGTFKVAAL
jgi:hypothetical protein